MTYQKLILEKVIREVETVNGQPMHPLLIPYKTTLIPYTK
jgi:hypothetical protein